MMSVRPAGFNIPVRLQALLLAVLLWVAVVCTGNQSSSPELPIEGSHASGWWFKSCEYFLDCVLTGRMPEPGVEEGVETSLVLMAMNQSLLEGRRVVVQDWTDRYAARARLSAGTTG
jgi:hypothetical protein